MSAIILAFVAVVGAEVARVIVRVYQTSKREAISSRAYALRVESNGAGTGAYWTL